MTREEFRRLLPDYLGDELSPAERARVEEYLAGAPQDRAEVEGLRSAQTALGARLVSLEAAERSAPAALPVAGAGRAERPVVARLAGVAARYVAVVLLAFAGGYATRGMMVGGADGGGERGVLDGGGGAGVRGSGAVPSIVHTDLAQKYVTAAQRYPQATELARALLTVARR